MSAHPRPNVIRDVDPKRSPGSQPPDSDSSTEDVVLSLAKELRKKVKAVQAKPARVLKIVNGLTESLRRAEETAIGLSSGQLNAELNAHIDECLTLSALA
ncbi:hypothetical protein ABPG77_005284 [Micractinium sp. CCAP 211/92]